MDVTWSPVADSASDRAMTVDITPGTPGRPGGPGVVRAGCGAHQAGTTAPAR